LLIDKITIKRISNILIKYNYYALMVYLYLLFSQTIACIIQKIGCCINVTHLRQCHCPR